MDIDIRLLYFLNNLATKSPFFDKLIIFFAEYLGYLLLLIFFGILYFLYAPRPEKIRIFLLSMLSAVIARFGITELIRFFYHRPRPFLIYTGIHNLIFENEWSFPSGHTTFFFAFSMAIYLYNKRWGTWFFIASFVISISRVIAGIHYPSDILGGALIGIFVGCVVYSFGNTLVKKWLRTLPVA